MVLELAEIGRLFLVGIIDIEFAILNLFKEIIDPDVFGEIGLWILKCQDSNGWIRVTMKSKIKRNIWIVPHDFSLPHNNPLVCCLVFHRYNDKWIRRTEQIQFGNIAY